MNLTSNVIRPCGRLLTLAGAALLALPSAATAADQSIGHPDKPLLWKVEGPGIQKPSYLFGTIHLGDKVVTTLHPAAQKAFDESVAFHAEVPMDARMQLATMDLVTRKDGNTLNASIGSERASKLDRELKRISPQLDASPFQTLKTFAVALMLPQLEEQMKGQKPLDLILWERAEKAGKSTAGIQSSEDQLRGLNSLTEAEQIECLDSLLSDLEQSRGNGESSISKVRSAYLSGDTDRIKNLLVELMIAGKASKELNDKLLKSLLHDRDAIMADYIAETVRKQPSSPQFFAVGAAHYCGEVSILTHLKKFGLTVTRIEE